MKHARDLCLPPQLVQLGAVLDLVTECMLEDEQIQRTEWEHSDVGGMLLCAQPGAMRRARAPLYLVRPVSVEPSEQAPSASASETYEAWHQREPAARLELDGLPDECSHFVGHCTRIGYRSDKWSEPGHTADYEHDYTEAGYRTPEVWADNPDLSRAQLIVLAGGNQRVTPQGID